MLAAISGTFNTIGGSLLGAKNLTDFYKLVKSLLIIFVVWVGIFTSLVYFFSDIWIFWFTSNEIIKDIIQSFLGQFVLAVFFDGTQVLLTNILRGF